MNSFSHEFQALGKKETYLQPCLYYLISSGDGISEIPVSFSFCFVSRSVLTQQLITAPWGMQFLQVLLKELSHLVLDLDSFIILKGI